MSVKGKFGDVRNQTDLADELRLQLHELISQAIKIGRGTFGMSAEQLNEWVSQQIEAFAESWAAAVEVKRSSAASAQADEHATTKRGGK